MDIFDSTSVSTSGPTIVPTKAPASAPTRGRPQLTRVDFRCLKPFMDSPRNVPQKVSTKMPTKVSTQVVEVHLSCFLEPFCWN